MLTKMSMEHVFARMNTGQCSVRNKPGTQHYATLKDQFDCHALVPEQTKTN